MRCAFSCVVWPCAHVLIGCDGLRDGGDLLGNRLDICRCRFAYGCRCGYVVLDGGYCGLLDCLGWRGGNVGNDDACEGAGRRGYSFYQGRRGLTTHCGGCVQCTLFDCSLHRLCVDDATDSPGNDGSGGIGSWTVPFAGRCWDGEYSTGGCGTWSLTSTR